MLGREGLQPEGFGFKVKASARFVVLVGVIRVTVDSHRRSVG